MLEVEIKIKLNNSIETRKKLLQLGAQKKFDMLHKDIYYNFTPIKDFSKTDEALRLRSTKLYDPVSKELLSDTNDLTYKGPKLHTIVKSRIEHVCKIVDAENMEHILNALGFTNIITVTKKREVYDVMFQNQEIEVLFDEIEHLTGFYLEAEIIVKTKDEIEQANTKLLDLIQELGYSKEDSIRESYLELILNTKIN